MQPAPGLTGKQNWSIESLPWDAFDASKVDPELLKIAKAAAMVEYNAHDYAAYLQNVFEGDPEFQAAAREWSQEEVMHGLALGRWAERADPTFNFEESFKRFTDGFKINLNTKESIRGSQAGELIARCIVETGTSSYYTALGDSCAEPVLKQICRNIAGDEHRHYKLFYSFLERYLEKDKLSKLDRLKIGLGRIAESEDDELAYAYFSANFTGSDDNAANDNRNAAYDRQAATNAYFAGAFSYYRFNHMEKIVAMVMKACGLKTQGLLAKTASKLAWYGVQAKLRNARRKTALAS